MNFTKVTPGNSKIPHQHKASTATEYDFPLRTSLTVKSYFTNSLPVEKEEEMAVSSQYDHNLHFDGLCQNTMDNIKNSVDDDEKKARERCVLSSSSVLMLAVVGLVVSLISLVLTVLLLTCNLSSRCSCMSTKDSAKQSSQTGNLSLSRGYQNGKRDLGTLFELLENISQQMKNQSRVFDKLKNNYISMNEKTEETEKRLTEFIRTTKELDTRMEKMGRTRTNVEYLLRKLNTTAQRHERAINKLRQDLGDTETDLKFEINNTKRSIKTSNSGFRNYIKNLNKTIMDMIANVTKLECPRGPKGKPGYNGTRGLPGIPGPSGVYGNSKHAANFSQCQYKVQASVGIKIVDPVNNLSDDIVVLEPKDKTIVGSTCSTDNAAEYNLSKLNVSGKYGYRCTCKGKSILFTRGSNMHCYIHYWECPIMT